MGNKDLVFKCLKCGHLIFVTGEPLKQIKKISSFNKIECPNCGEEGCENWVYVRKGNYDREYGISAKK